VEKLKNLGSPKILESVGVFPLVREFVHSTILGNKDLSNTLLATISMFNV
jgi:hypothetical protein